MADPELGRATIVYDDPEEGVIETDVQNERIAYFDDHWMVKVGEDAEGNDVVRRVPRERVHYVERSVEEFQDKVDQVIDEATSQLPIE